MSEFRDQPPNRQGEIDSELEWASDVQQTDGPDREELQPSHGGLLNQRPVPGALNAPALWVAWCCLVSAVYWWSPWAGQVVANKEQVMNGDRPWLLLTGMLAHADMAHLVSNSGLFLLFGWLLRAYIGALAFPSLALLAALLTQLLSLWTYSDGVVLIGASGMVYAMAGMWLCYYFFCTPHLAVKKRLFRILGFSLIVLLPTQIQVQVSYRAHAIGFGLGVAIAVISLPWVIPELERRIQRGKYSGELEDKLH